MGQINPEHKTILISRTDSIGDVILTIPLALWLKQTYPSIKLIFLGNAYTNPVISCFPAVDKIIHWKEIEDLSEEQQIKLLQSLKIDICIHVFPNKKIAKLIKKVKIPYRIGTSHRFFHWNTCNFKVNFTRKKSHLHEAQLNFKLLKPIGYNDINSLNELTELVSVNFIPPQIPLPQTFENISNSIILHPKSQGSAIEWPIEKYILLAEKLLENGERVVFTGTEKEGLLFRNIIPKHSNCIDATGKMSLAEFILFISKSKALVACSTGPYHIAGISGIKAIGLFSSRRPIHPGRWKAIGKNAHALEFDPNCSTCAKGEKCTCLEKIDHETVATLLLS